MTVSENRATFVAMEKTCNTTVMNTWHEIYFAGGCFWGTEHFFKQVRGVEKTEVGYANGHTERPTYQQVRTSTTGFAETVHVYYDPEVVKLELLLQLYFKAIDPTTVDRQGEDAGNQYRTGIYYTDDADRETIEKEVQELSAHYSVPLALEVRRLQNFYTAEEYHQDYLDKHVDGYCHIRPELFQLAREANR